MTKKSIALYICVNGREEITPKVQECLVDLLSICPYNIKVFVNATTRRDWELWTDIADVIAVYDDRPLGAKFNAMIPEILSNECDYLMQLGQDNIIDLAYWDFVRGRIEDDCPMFGCYKLEVKDWASGKSFVFTSPTVFGAGRMIKMDLIFETYRKNGYIWRSDLNKGLDNDSEYNILKACELYQKGVTRARLLHEPYPLVTDLKTKDNINSFEHLKQFANG